jgi:predicted Zn finger-like uncharacterized protein
MPQILQCPGCGASLRVREEYAGKNVKCPKCSKPVKVPEAAAAVEAPGQEQPAAAPPAPVESAPLRRAPPPLPEEVSVTPVDDQEVAQEVRPLARKTRPCPACGEPNPVSARRCRQCREWLDEKEEDRRPRRRPAGGFKPCPRCGATGATRVTWTIWGSFYGPALFNHVRCPECRYAYNGRSGRSNLVPAIFFVTIPAILIAAIVGVVVWLIVANLRAR